MIRTSNYVTFKKKKGEQPEKLGSETAEGLTENSDQLVRAVRKQRGVNKSTPFQKNYFYLKKKKYNKKRKPKEKI